MSYYINGFYEHHHLNGKTFPFYIHQKTYKPLALAGLWSEWSDQETGKTLNTFSIVTTKGNKMLAKIHNNPKLEGPRMPLILPQELVDKWLQPIEDELNVKLIQELIKEYPNEELDAYTVRRLRRKEYIWNVEKVSEPFEYTELNALWYGFRSPFIFAPILRSIRIQLHLQIHSPPFGTYQAGGQQQK